MRASNKRLMLHLSLDTSPSSIERWPPPLTQAGKSEEVFTAPVPIPTIAASPLESTGGPIHGLHLPRNAPCNGLTVSASKAA